MSRKKSTILIIDDEEEIRESIELFLNSEGLSTDTAATGEAGLKKIHENSHDLVLLDLMLPGKSGMEVHKAIKMIALAPLQRGDEHFAGHPRRDP